MNIKDIPERIAYLILLYLHGELSLSQREELDYWISQSEERAKLFEEATDFFE